MNLGKLFNMQKELDERILNRFPDLRNKDLLDKKILALQVELGELAQNWRGFKFWSENQEPNRTGYIDCDVCTDQPGRYEVIHDGEILSLPCSKCEGHEEVYIGDPLLEEYVDCLHFILSIGLELGYDYAPTTKWQARSITVQFNDLFHTVATFNESIESDWDEEEKQENFENMVGGFLGLGDMLQFNWEEIEQAYFDKNKINHERQENGY